MEGHPIDTICVFIKPDNPNFGAIYRVTSAVLFTAPINPFTGQIEPRVALQMIEPVGFHIKGPYSRAGRALACEPRYLTPLTDPDAEIINEREALEEGA